MRPTIQVFMFALCVCCFGIQIKAQTTAINYGDARVAKLLRQANTPYKMDESDSYEVILKMPGNRSQTVVIYSATFKNYGVEMRSVFSVAMVSDNRPSPEIANLLLEKDAIDPGAWGVVKTEYGKFSIVNVIYISADADGKTLNMAMQTVAKAADAMEERLTKKDGF